MLLHILVASLKGTAKKLHDLGLTLIKLERKLCKGLGLQPGGLCTSVYTQHIRSNRFNIPSEEHGQQQPLVGEPKPSSTEKAVEY